MKITQSALIAPLMSSLRKTSERTLTRMKIQAIQMNRTNIVQNTPSNG